MTSDVVASRILSELRERSDAEKGRMVARYMKTSRLEFCGISVTEVRRIAKKHIASLSDDDLPPLLHRLWSDAVFDHRIAAIQTMERYSAEGPIEESLNIISRWIDDVDTWSILDPLCITCLGTLIIRSPKVETEIADWRTSDNHWRRRATVVPYVHLSKKRYYRPEYDKRILKGVSYHLRDREFFVAKAVGWALRELSHRAPGVVSSFLEQNRDKMVPLAVREASKTIESEPFP